MPTLSMPGSALQSCGIHQMSPDSRPGIPLDE